MPDAQTIQTRPERDDSVAQLLTRMVEILHRNGGRVAGKRIDNGSAYTGLDCTQFVAGGSGATISSGTFPDFDGSVNGIVLAAGQPFPFEFTSIQLSDGDGWAINKESPS